MSEPEFTTDQIVETIGAALRAGDMRGVEACLRVLAVQDPHRAQDVLDVLNVGLSLRKGDDR